MQVFLLCYTLLLLAHQAIAVDVPIVLDGALEESVFLISALYPISLQSGG